MIVPRVRRALPVAGIALLAACATWVPRSGPDAATRAHARATPQHPVRLTLRNGQVLTVTALVVSGDSLLGIQGDARQPHARVAVPLGDVQTIEQRDVDPGRTIGLVVAITGIGAALWLALVLAAGST